MALTDTKTTARRSLGELFACLFKKYPKLLIANLLFAVPLAVSALIVWLIGAYVMPLNIFSSYCRCLSVCRFTRASRRSHGSWCAARR